ncbi:MAG: ParB N-terminal domain-containing protein [Firmicutes bacterium]|nr:ParB N-terminal domain-containing protein [Bacillota bacterium]
MNEKTTSQHIALIALADIAPSDYQRSTNPTQVANIVKRFDEAKLGTLTVSDRDGKFHIIDGAHRARALRTLGYTHALCVVLTGLTYEQEAEYYRTQNQDKRPLTQADLFKAGLASGDEQCLKINRIVEANGFKIGMAGRNFFKIAAINTLYTIAEAYGYAELDDTLCLIATTWSGIERASQRECLLGVAEFVHHYGLADFAERMRDKFSVVWYDYTEAMRVQGSIGSATSSKKFCCVLVEHYNRGLKRNSKKYLKWDDRP